MLKATLLSITCLFIVICHGQSTSQVLTFDKTTNKANISSGRHRIIEMDFDSAGNLFVFGEFNEEINLTLNSDDPVILSCWQDSNNYESGGSLFLAKYNSRFDLIAYNQISLNTNFTRGNDIDWDNTNGFVKFSKNGNCFIITKSLYADQIYLRGDKKVLVPNAEQHILKFNPSLTLDWVKQIPEGLFILDFDIRENPNELILSGQQSGNADFDPDPKDQYKIPNYQPDNFPKYTRAAFISVYDWEFDFSKAASLSGKGVSFGFALSNKNNGYYFVVSANHFADIILKDSSGYIGVTGGTIINKQEKIIFNLNNDFSLKSGKFTNTFDIDFFHQKPFGRSGLNAIVDNLGKLYLAFSFSKDSVYFWSADNTNNTLILSPNTIRNNTMNVGMVCLNNNIEWINIYGGYNQKMTINDLKLDEEKNLWFSGSGSDEIGKDEYGYWSIDFNPNPDSSNYVAYYNGQVPSCDYKSQYYKYYEGYSNFLCRVDSNGQFGFAGGIYSANGIGSSSILNIATGPNGTLYGGNLSGQSRFNRPSKGARFSNSNADSTRPLIAVNVDGVDGAKMYIAKYQSFDNQKLNHSQPNNININIFPNPVQNTIYIEGLKTTPNEKMYYQIFNLTGSIVQSGEIKNNAIRLNKGVKTGQYLVQILSVNNELLKSSFIIYQ